ncbi:aminotransferase class I/II-fold pyridoxal phosphate-dependent enzyme [Nannocystis sp. SCPEA4]|uniref:pyridoxal phosphate-dependent aminotransferase n=1 Tax=Nannocystis sp. SCPEA4 TaxID=2996787 RepID=UPI0022701E02|nr:aminotransferase class I/II-fold pyridoxal phosphate-dependent enzyme [Nannocystis sp. SCPEA4]
MQGRPSLNLQVRGLAPSATVSINERSNDLLAAGREVFKLGLGQSPFPIPDSVVEALRANAARKEYMPVRGLPALRDAVAAYHQRGVDGAHEYSGEHVLVGPGSKELMFITQLAFYGDLVLPSPAWVSYSPQARIIGRQVVWLPTRADNGWKLTPADIDALCRRDRGRPRVLILNYPSNPTGQTYGGDELAALAEVLRAHDVLVVSDEIYGELHHDGAHTTIARFYPEGTIVSSGLSKWCGAGGWRLGTFLFPRELEWLQRAMIAVASETYTSTSAPIQCAAVAAFAFGRDIAAYVAHEQAILKALGGWCHRRLLAGGIACAAPQGGFYLFPEFHAHADSLRRRGIAGGEALCERLLEETGVAILPGSEFGRPYGDLTARLAYVDFDGGPALAAHDPQRPIDDAWLRRFAPRVLTAIERLVAFVAA